MLLFFIFKVIGFISALLGKTGTKMDIYGKYLKKMSDEKVSASIDYLFIAF